MAVRNGEEKAGVGLEVREWWRKQKNGQREGGVGSRVKEEEEAGTGGFTCV